MDPQSRLIAAALLLATSACVPPREPGIKETEFGATFFWAVDGLPRVSVTPACEDQEPPEPPELPENSYLVYTVSKDGKTAAAQDCDRVDADSCEPSELGLEFDVKDDELTAETREPLEELSETCTHVGVLDWTVKDQGEEGELLVDAVADLDGDGCEEFEPLIDPECRASLEISLLLEHIDRP